MATEDQLTAAEAKFFETGELSPELAAENHVEAPEQAPQQEADASPAQPRSVEDPGAVAPVLTPAAPPAPVAQPDFFATLQRQLIEAESRRIAAEQRLNDLVAQLQATQQAETPPPDPEADPFGHMQHQVNQISKAMQAMQANQQQQDQTAGLNTYLTGFVNQVREMRDAFQATTPDFKDAYAHVRQMRTNDLRDAGVPETNLPAALLQDEMALAQSALATGRNPAAVLYDMAKRHGYAPKPVPVPPANRIAQLQAGQEAARNVPRAGADIVLSPESLREASETDLDKLVQSEDMWNKVVGGGRNSNSIF